MVDSENNSQVVITITLIRDSLNSTGVTPTAPIVFTPSLDQNGNYRIKIDHNNSSSKYYVLEGGYTINYSVRLASTNQFTEGKPYKAYIIDPDKCNPIKIPFVPIELTRTGGVALAQFTTVILLIIGLVYLGERKREW